MSRLPWWEPENNIDDLVDNSDYGNFKAWCKVQGLPMPVSNPEDEDKAETLILDGDQTAERARWTAEWPLPAITPLDSGDGC